ncbi:MAG: response regulator [Elusimicrobiota bacterium]
MSNPKILVVDDNRDARVGLEQYLSAENFEIESADSGEQAVELLKDNKYSIVLADLKMQDIDGIGVLEETKRLHPNTEVIIMTAYASVDTAVKAMKAGAYDYVSKPLNMEEILVLLERCLEKQNLVREVSGLKQIVNLYEVSQKLSTVIELDELLTRIIKLASDALNADGGSIMLYDSKKNELEIKAAQGTFKKKVEGKRLQLGERFAGKAAILKKPLLSENEKDKKWFQSLQQFEDINSGMSVPMIVKGKLIGTVNLKRTALEEKFSEKDIKLLSIFAQQAAVAIENSYLFRNLEQEKNKLSSLFSNMGDGAIMVNGNFKIMLINSTAKKFFNCPGEECRGRDIRNILNGFSPSKSWQKIKNSDSQTETFELAKKDPQPVYLAGMATKIKDNNDKTINIIFVLRDITDHKKETLIKKNFLRLMSHKLRTPLTSALGFLDMLTQDKTLRKLDDSEKEFVSVIDQKTNQLSSLVDKLLRFTLLETETLSLNKNAVSLKKIVTQSLEALEPLINKSDVDVKLRGFENLDKLKLDGEKFQEVLENLIENGIKFNDKKEKKIWVTAEEKENNITLTVEDNGPGIPLEKQSTVFEKYQQLEDSFTGQVEGIGLGLALVKKVVNSHDGKITIKNRTEEGCKFIITLPKN